MSTEQKVKTEIQLHKQQETKDTKELEEINDAKAQLVTAPDFKTVHASKPSTSDNATRDISVVPAGGVANTPVYIDNKEAVIDLPLEDVGAIIRSGRKKKREAHILKLVTNIFEIIKRGSALLDAITDLILLYTAARRSQHDDTKLFMIILCISLISPYILSYSSGIELFLYRKTFQNVKKFSFKSFLLTLYILPTGVLYFIVIDIFDALLSIYKLIGVIRCKSAHDILKMESNAIEYFGMSRMDWISFRKQKQISQLSFETVPQVILQTLLFFSVIPGKELTGITNQALLLSVCSAGFNCIATLFVLFAESRGVDESFVEYSLHCITARWGWVPFQFILSDYFAGKLNTKEFNRQNNNICRKIFGFKLKEGAIEKENESTLIIDYDMKHRIPLITYLSQEAVTKKIEYQFSENTLKSFMATIKSSQTKYDMLRNRSRSVSPKEFKTFKLQMYFAKSLNLLPVRQIINLMQCCQSINIKLPDIHEIDWNQAFNNTKIEDDPRLWSNTFDEKKRSLLISVYLTGYNNNNWQILRKFVYDFDVAINVQDNEGNTILHHMLKQKDEDAIKVLFDSLKPTQRINFDIKNDEGDILIHEIIKIYGMDGLKSALNVLKPRETINFNAQDINGDTIFHHLIKRDRIDLLNDILFAISINSTNIINLSVENNSKQSVVSMALEHDKTYLRELLKNKNQMVKQKSAVQDVDYSETIQVSKDDDDEPLIVEEEKEEEEEEEEQAKDEHDEQHDEDDNANDNDEEKDENEDEDKTKDEHDEQHDEDDNDNEEKDEAEDKKKDELEMEWNEFENVWLAAMDHTLINSRTLINIAFLKINRIIGRTAYAEMDLKTKQKRLQKIEKKIKKLYKKCPKQKMRKLFKIEIKECEKRQREITMPEHEDEEYEVKMIEEETENYEDQMMHPILLKYDANININKYAFPQQSILGYALVEYEPFPEYFDIINHLLSYRNIKLMAHEISIFVKLFVKAAGKDNSIKYFELYENVLFQNNIIMEPADGNTPIHYLVTQHQKKESTELYINKLNKLCKRYPQWLFIKNGEEDLPLIISIAKKDLDGFFCLTRFMSEYKKTELDRIITSQYYVSRMIILGGQLLEKVDVHRTVLLLQCFDYYEIFYHPSSKTHIDNVRYNNNLNEDNFISLLKWVSAASYRNNKYKWVDVEKILFEHCGLNKNVHFKEYIDHQAVGTIDDKPTNEIIIDWKDYFNDVTRENKNKNLIMNAMNENEEEEEDENKLALMVDDLFVEEGQYVNWVEIIYSTIVESFSAMDVYTDMIIFIDLYRTDNAWWSTMMAILIISPYLVAYGSLSTLLLTKLSYFRKNFCLSLFVLLLMTPLSVIYLFTIDLIFMMHSLSSTFIFMICGCRPKYDIKDYLDEYVFNKLLKMNRTEIIGYRRLRTLSQLAFESIPQILLQARILYVIELEGKNNQFQIDVSTLLWSMALAIAHLILEGGVIYFDSTTLKMQFVQYCMICLGGRVQWVPYQHFLEFIVKNQLFMNNIFDIEYTQQQLSDKQVGFDALQYSINCMVLDDEDGEEEEIQMDDDDIEDEEKDDNDSDDNADQDAITVKKNVMALSYEDIESDILCFRYKIIFQFSNALIQHLIQQLINSPSIVIPKQFKLSTTNVCLQNFLKTILCRSELHLGYESCGNINIYSLCELYEASLNKLKLNINKIDSRTIKKIEKHSILKGDNDFQELVTSSLINFGELSAIEWIYNIHNLSYKQKQNIASKIADNILPSMHKTLIDLVPLRNCFKNKYYMASNCYLMKRIKEEVVEEFSSKCEYDGSWCYVLMIFLLYCQGTIFWSDCINGCCKNIIKTTKLNELFKKYLASVIEYKDMLIPYQLFECSKLFKPYQVEQILINQCKNWIIFNDISQKDYNFKKNDVVTINLPSDSKNNTAFQFIGEKEYNQLIKKLLAPEIEYEDVSLLDEIVYEFKLYRNYNSYLNKTLKYRVLINCETKVKTGRDNAIELKLHDLIRDWTENNDKRFQIYEIILSTHEEKEDRNIQQIYFKNINEKTSALNDMIYLYNPQEDKNIKDEDMVKELIIDQNNVALSYYNYNLLHHPDNIPKIMIKTTTECQISVYMQYSYLYRKEDKVAKKAHPEMTIFSYSKLLFDTMQLHLNMPDMPDNELMNLCFEMALWVTLPNKAIFERDLKEFIEILERCELVRNVVIAQIIATFIIHPRNYLAWQQFATMEHATLTNAKKSYLQDQLVYQCGDNMVDYRNARRDYINVPTPILDRSKKTYYINVYMWGKGDENLFGLIPVKDYDDDMHNRGYAKTAVIATGGRMHYINRAGGFKNSPCTGHPIDCNHGNIRKGNKVIVHPLDAQIPGDWLNFHIDFEKNWFGFYKNGIFQAKVENEIPEGDVFFVSFPDTAVDKFYIEQEVDIAVLEQIVGDTKYTEND